MEVAPLAEVPERLGVSDRQVRQLVANGELRAKRFERSCAVDVASVNERLGAKPVSYLDYVRRSGGGIVDLTRAVSTIGERLGMEVRTKIGRHPKIFLRAPFESGAGTMRVKVEVNTVERSPARPLTHVHHAVSSP